MSETEGVSLPVQAETNPLSSLELEVPEVQVLYEEGTNLIAQQIQKGTLKPEQASNSSLRTAIENQHHALLAVVQEKKPDLKAKGVRYDPQTQEFSYLPLDQVNQEGAQPIKGQTNIADTLDCLAAIRDLDVPEGVKAKAGQHLEALKAHALIEVNGQKTTVAAYEEKVGKLPEEAKVSLVGKISQKPEESVAPEEAPEILTVEEFHRLCQEHEINPGHFDHIATLVGRAREEDPNKIIGEMIDYLKKNPLPEEDGLKLYQAVFKKLTGEDPDPKIQNPAALIINLVSRPDAQEKFGQYFPFEPDWRYKLNKITSRREAQLAFRGIRKVTPSQHTLLIAAIFAIPLLDKTVSSEAE